MLFLIIQKINNNFNEKNYFDYVRKDRIRFFFQSLLDGHDQILSLPGVFYFDEFLKVKTDFALNFTKIYEKFFDSRLNTYERHHQLGLNKNEFYRVSKEDFINHYNDLTHLDEKVTEKLLERIHFAYAKAKGEDISKKKLLFYTCIISIE